MILIKLNGEEKSFSQSINLKQLIEMHLDNLEFVVVEHNYKIVDKNDWQNIFVSNNDNIEIISFVGGG